MQDLGSKLSVARKADVIGREDVGKRVGNVIVIKVRAAVQRGLEADALLLCFAGLGRNLSSSSSDLVSANKTTRGIENTFLSFLFCLYFLQHTGFLNNTK